MAKLLIISSQAPYFTSGAQDALEAALAASNVGVEVSYVFCHKGIYQLLTEQNSGVIEKKSILKQIKVLPLYDVNRLYFIKEDARSLCVRESDLYSEVKPLALNELTDLCNSYDAILRF